MTEAYNVPSKQHKRQVVEGDLEHNREENFVNKKHEEMKVVKIMALQGKGEDCRRRKDIAAARLREILIQLRPKGKRRKFKANKGDRRKEGRQPTHKGGSLEHVVWSRVRGKIMGIIKSREATIADERKEVAAIEQRRKGLP